MTQAPGAYVPCVKVTLDIEELAGAWRAQASAGSERVGTMLVHRVGDEWVLEDVAVDEPYRRRGIATALLAMCECKCGAIERTAARSEDGEAWWEARRGRPAPSSAVSFWQELT
jgi:GNAT superfamily N-acetyltransferase